MPGNQQDLIGKRGESATSTALFRPLASNNAILFNAEFLGDKAGVLDFLVRLLDNRGGLLGPFFFVQVKTTTNPTKVTADAIKINFSKEHVKKANEMKIPCYLFAVDATAPNSEKVYFCGISSTRRTAIRGIHKKHDLADDLQRWGLYEEVRTFFSSLSISHRTKFNPA